MLFWKEVVALESEDECMIGAREPAALHDMPPEPAHLAATVAAVLEDCHASDLTVQVKL